MKNIVTTCALVLFVLAAIAAVVIASGVYNVAADEEHTALGGWILETARERSIAARTSAVAVPDLSDAERIRRGAGNYDAMCVSCHLAPGIEPTELSRGLNPTPPDLTKIMQRDAARAFWIIKHGVKATGMPAWGRSMEDEYVWDLVAFAQRLPEMSPEQYAAEVAASEGHSHGAEEDAEADEHGHTHDDAADAHKETAHTHSTPTAKREHDAEPHSHGSDLRDPVNVAKALHPINPAAR